MNKLFNSLIFFTFLLTLSCVRDTVEEKKIVTKLNTFEMTLNDKSWVPSLINSNDCLGSFGCSISRLDQNPFYKIEAFTDPSGVTSINSENFFEIQIMNVTETGVFTIDEKYGDFGNYARLTVNDVDGKRVYENKESSISFTVTVEELYPALNSNLTGIKGSFKGILYNKSNPLDSIQIDGGKFTFKRINTNNFNQCDN